MRTASSTAAPKDSGTPEAALLRGRGRTGVLKKIPRTAMALDAAVSTASNAASAVAAAAAAVGIDISKEAALLEPAVVPPRCSLLPWLPLPSFGSTYGVMSTKPTVGPTYSCE